MAQRSPTLAAIEAEVADSTDDVVRWFEVLSRYEPLRSWADQLDEEERRLIVYKFRLFRAFEKHIMAEFRLEDIAGYLIPANGDIRSRVCLLPGGAQGAAGGSRAQGAAQGRLRVTRTSQQPCGQRLLRAAAPRDEAG